MSIPRIGFPGDFLQAVLLRGDIDHRETGFSFQNLTEGAVMSVGFAAHTIRPEEAYIPWARQEARNREMLSHALNLRDTIIFVGSGCSIPLGYPSWQKARGNSNQHYRGKILQQHLF